MDIDDGNGDYDEPRIKRQRIEDAKMEEDDTTGDVIGGAPADAGADSALLSARLGPAAVLWDGESSASDKGQG